jgi:hypothetical protein
MVLAVAAGAGLVLSRLLCGRRPVARTRRAVGVVARGLSSSLTGILLRWGMGALEGYMRRRLAGGSGRLSVLQRPDPHATMPPSSGG